MILALAAFAWDVGAGEGEQIVLVLDNVGWHSIKEVEVPTGLKLVFLPAATPELQPAERFWSLVREAVASQSFGSLDDLQETLVE